jgi:hypothetical protein
MNLTLLLGPSLFTLIQVAGLGPGRPTRSTGLQNRGEGLRNPSHVRRSCKPWSNSRSIQHTSVRRLDPSGKDERSRGIAVLALPAKADSRDTSCIGPTQWTAERSPSEVTHPEIGDSVFAACGEFSAVADRTVLANAAAANPNAGSSRKVLRFWVIEAACPRFSVLNEASSLHRVSCVPV